MSEDQVKTLLVIEPTPEAPRNSEGAIIRLSDGSLFLAYTRFTGGGHDHSAADIAARVSKDGGATWSEDALLVENEGRQNVMSVSLHRLGSGEILLFYLVKNSDDDCRPYLRRSGDEMRTLSAPVCATPLEGYHVVNNDRIVQLSTGRLICPASLHTQTGGERMGWQRGVMTCTYSDDEGHTWQASRSRLEAPPESGSGLQEPGVVELADGRLYSWSRTDMGCQYESFSEDGGETWSEARPSPMASPVSPATIKRVPWGEDLLLVWNDHSGAHPFPEGKRSPLCTAVSSDEGRNWRNSKVIEGDPDGWYCYISMMFEGETVILSYCAGDTVVGGLNRLKVTQIHRNWLYAP